MKLEEVFSGDDEAVEYWRGSTPDAQLYMLGCLIMRVLRVAEPLAASVAEMKEDQAEVVAVLQQVADVIDPRKPHQAPRGEPDAAPPALPSSVVAPADEDGVTPEVSTEQLVSTSSSPADATPKRERRRKPIAAT